MSEAPKRIWADGDYTWSAGSWFLVKGHDDVEYIRADLVEAAIKRALEEAANMIRDGMDDSEWYNPVRAIRALDPAQFIEEPKG
jgi:hypothetical protein